MANIGHFERVRALAATARTIVTAGVRLDPQQPTEIVSFDIVTSKNTGTIEVPCGVWALALSGEHLVSGGVDGALRFHGASGGKTTRTVENAHAGGVYGVCLGPDGDRVYSVGGDGAARVWSRSDGKKITDYALSAQTLRAVALDPTGEFLAAAGDDGVVRVVTLATGAVREMSGHEGAVFSLVFTPRDGRLASGGEDGTVRLWYVVGDVESEVRGGGDDGHQGPVFALMFPPTPEATPQNTEPSDRLYSAGGDGKVKSWPIENRRKPKTYDYGVKAVYALAFKPALPQAASYELGTFIFAGDRRTVLQYPIDKAGTPADAQVQYGHAFDVLEQEINQHAPAQRTKAVKTLGVHEEPEAQELLLRVLRNDRDENVRLEALGQVAEKKRVWARNALKELLDDGRAAVRVGALEALRKIDGPTSVTPLKLALTSKHKDMRAFALKGLTPLREHSPLVPGLVAGLLTDGESMVRLTALDELTKLHPEGSPEPLRVAYERGGPSLKIEALTRAARAGQTHESIIAPLLVRGLDDADESVRRMAFTVKVLERRALAHVLEDKDEDFARTLKDLARRAAQLAKGQSVPVEGTKAPTDEETAAARKAFPGEGEPGRAPEDADLDPLLTAMSCHTPDTALRGARGLAQLGDTRALGALLQLSRESNPSLRREAARALRELEDPRARKRLLWMLDDSDANVRAAALDAFSKLETSPVAVAEAALRGSFEDIRVRGLEQLVKLGSGDNVPPPEAETLLGDALEDEATKVRSEAFRTLWAWHAKDPAKAIDRALSARFADLRVRAVGELVQHGKEKWSRERLATTIGDRDVQVATAAYDALVKLEEKEAPEPHRLALATTHPSLRAQAATASKHAPADALKTELSKLLQDEQPSVRTAAIDSLEKLAPKDSGALYAALQSGFYDLKVRAAEHLAARKDEQLIEPMRAFLGDKELFKRFDASYLNGLRARAASAIASLGSQRTVKYLATELLKDDFAGVREQAARGLSVAARRGDEGYLLDALGHEDVAVRSWAADGLSRLGDVRALPVLTGNLRHNHLPIRLGAILSFAALGPEGFGGMLQGLDDSLTEVQERVFAIIIARDLRAVRQGQAPDLLTSALSSQRPEVRFSAARALELRADPEAYLAHVIEVLMPPKPEKVGDMKDWPAEEQRARSLVALAESLASDEPETRYAAAQVLNLRSKPVEYFREAARIGKLRPANTPVQPETTPRGAEEGDAKPKRGWLRRLFSGDAPETANKGPKESKADPKERDHLQRLAFGAYVGLLRQVTSGDDESHRVRRDAVDRIVDLGIHGSIGVASALPPVVRALEDPHNLVRKAAFGGLKKLFKDNPNQALSLALEASAGDVARLALDELATQGESTKGRIAAALNSDVAEVRRYAFELLERLSPKGSLDPLFAALASEHASLRVGVLERLALTDDTRVVQALGKALESDHDDLRLRAAELLAQRKDDRTSEVLAAFLRSDDTSHVQRAQHALVQLATAASVNALAARMEELAQEQRPNWMRLLAGANAAASTVVELAAARVDSESPAMRSAAWDTALSLAGRDRKKRVHALLLPVLRTAVRSRDPEIRKSAAVELEFAVAPEGEAEKLLAGLFGDRDVNTRIAAVNSYAQRVVDPEKKAPVAPLREVLRVGARELVLPSAEAVAFGGDAFALRPLLLVARAGEPHEQTRALLALGTLGDPRALDELETIAAGGTEEAPALPAMQAAATEALGRLAPKLKDADARKRVIDKIESATSDAPHAEVRVAAVRGVRYVGGGRAREKLENLLLSRFAATEVRAEAAAQLGLVHEEASEQALALALNDREYVVRTAARAALDSVFPKERTRIEFFAIDSNYGDVSEKAAEYLANEGDPKLLVPRLASLKNPALRSRLRFGLVRRGALPAQETAALLASDDASVREEAAWIIGSSASKDTPAADRALLGTGLEKAIRTASERWATGRKNARPVEARAWTRALWAASRLGTSGVIALARTALTGGDKVAPPEVRHTALLALRALGEKDLALYQGALSDVDATVRTAAAAAVSEIAPDRAAKIALSINPFDPASFAATAKVAVDRPELIRKAEGRRLVLAPMVAQHESKPLIDALDEKNEPQLRLAAALALARVGDDEALAALKALAADRKLSKELRRAADRGARRIASAKKRADFISKRKGRARLPGGQKPVSAG